MKYAVKVRGEKVVEQVYLVDADSKEQAERIAVQRSAMEFKRGVEVTKTAGLVGC